MTLHTMLQVRVIALNMDSTPNDTISAIVQEDHSQVHTSSSTWLINDGGTLNIIWITDIPALLLIHPVNSW